MRAKLSSSSERLTEAVGSSYEPSRRCLRLYGSRLLGLAAVAYMVAAGVGLSGAGNAAARTGTTTARCAISDLDVWLDTEGNGAAGSIYYNLEFTNLSGHTCTVFGYPGVSAVDLTGHQIGSPAARNPHLTPRIVVLAAGATAAAIIQITEAGNFPSATCRKVTAAGLRVYPPGQTGSMLVHFPFAACSRSRPVYLHVEAVAKV